MKGTRRYSTDELLGDLRRVYREAGRAVFSFPIYSELGRYAAATIIARFGTWRAACRAAGVMPVRLHPYWRINLRKQQEIGVTRSCLKCNDPFKSWNPKKNRLCAACNAANADLCDDEPYLMAL